MRNHAADGVATGKLHSAATGLRCGAGGSDRSGFPANSSGAAVFVRSPTSGPPPSVLPSYSSVPVTLVCSSCLPTYGAASTAACTSVAHRYSAANAATGEIS